MKVFGGNAGFQQIAQIGSLAAGTPVYSIDPDVLQALSNYVDGWFDVTIGNNSPAIEDMNALCYLYAYQLAYILQTGVAEWNATTNYFTNSMVSSGNQVYVSLIDNNLNNAVTTANWAVLAPSNVHLVDPSTDSPYTMTKADNGKIFMVDSTTAAMVFTLPDPTVDANFNFQVIDSGGNSAVNNITVNPHASEKINGLSSFILSSAYAQASFKTNGTDWYAPSSGGFAFFTSSPVTTSSTGVTSTSFVTFNNSPAFTITPTITGTYKVYSTIPINLQQTGVIGAVRIFNTSGAATLLSEASAILDSTANSFSSLFAQSVYTLTAGVTYVFDIQGLSSNPSFNTVLRGDQATIYMYCERVG